MKKAAGKKLRDLRSAVLLPAPAPARRNPPAPRKVVTSVKPPPRRLAFGPLRLLDSLAMRAGRRLAMRIASNLVELVIYGAIALIIGLASAWYMMDVGSRLTVRQDGPWQRWTQAGSPDADPYTKAHFSRAGWLPVTTSSIQYFVTSKDSAGDAMYADCDYTLTGATPAGRQWSLAAFDMQGQPLDAGAARAVLTSSNALFGPENSLIVHLSQATTPGNWLGLTGAARFQLLLTISGRTDQAIRPVTGVAGSSGFSSGSTGRPPSALPNIVKAGCR